MMGITNCVQATGGSGSEDIEEKTVMCAQTGGMTANDLGYVQKSNPVTATITPVYRSGNYGVIAGPMKASSGYRVGAIFGDKLYGQNTSTGEWDLIKSYTSNTLGVTYGFWLKYTDSYSIFSTSLASSAGKVIIFSTYYEEPLIITNACAIDSSIDLDNSVTGDYKVEIIRKNDSDTYEIAKVNLTDGSITTLYSLAGTQPQSYMYIRISSTTYLATGNYAKYALATVNTETNVCTLGAWSDILSSTTSTVVYCMYGLKKYATGSSGQFLVLGTNNLSASHHNNNTYIRAFLFNLADSTMTELPSTDPIVKNISNRMFFSGFQPSYMCLTNVNGGQFDSFQLSVADYSGYNAQLFNCQGEPQTGVSYFSEVLADYSAEYRIFKQAPQWVRGGTSNDYPWYSFYTQHSNCYLTRDTHPLFSSTGYLLHNSADKDYMFANCKVGDSAIAYGAQGKIKVLK